MVFFVCIILCVGCRSEYEWKTEAFFCFNNFFFRTSFTSWPRNLGTGLVI